MVEANQVDKIHQGLAEFLQLRAVDNTPRHSGDTGDNQKNLTNLCENVVERGRDNQRRNTTDVRQP